MKEVLQIFLNGKKCKIIEGGHSEIISELSKFGFVSEDDEFVSINHDPIGIKNAEEYVKDFIRSIITNTNEYNLFSKLAVIEFLYFSDFTEKPSVDRYLLCPFIFSIFHDQTGGKNVVKSVDLASGKSISIPYVIGSNSGAIYIDIEDIVFGKFPILGNYLMHNEPPIFIKKDAILKLNILKNTLTFVENSYTFAESESEEIKDKVKRTIDLLKFMTSYKFLFAILMETY